MDHKSSQKKVDKVFKDYSYDLHDKLRENADLIYNKLFPVKPYDHELFSAVCSRLLLELSVVFAKRKGKKHVKGKAKKATPYIDDRVGG